MRVSFDHCVIHVSDWDRSNASIAMSSAPN